MTTLRSDGLEDMMPELQLVGNEVLSMTARWLRNRTVLLAGFCSTKGGEEEVREECPVSPARWGHLSLQYRKVKNTLVCDEICTSIT